MAVTTYITAYGFLGDSGPYGLNIIINGCDQTPVDPLNDDVYEDNDTFQTATENVGYIPISPEP